MNALKIGLIPFVVLISNAASAVDRIFPVTTGQIGYCRGVVAETKPTGSRGHFITGTALWVETGPIAAKETFDFYDDQALLGGGFREPADAYSSAGCADCLGEYSRYIKVATSEHFWQEQEYEYYKDYCPNSWTYGHWFPSEYCEVLIQTHPGCMEM